MPPQVIRLPHGQTYTVTPIFGGYNFRSNDLDIHHSLVPPGWSVTLQTEAELDDAELDRLRKKSTATVRHWTDDGYTSGKATVAHRFTQPTLRNDSLYISSITMPSSSDFKVPSSPSRHIALILFVTLHWYFHKPAPPPQLRAGASDLTPEAGRPKGDWRVRIKKEGLLKGKNTLQKLERMGLVASEESSVGADTDIRDPDGWSDIFVSRKAFWQLDGRIFLFTLAPVHHSPFPLQSPYPSRPPSPDQISSARGSPRASDQAIVSSPGGLPSDQLAGISSPGGPFASSSHRPTFYPAAPTQFTFTNHIRHPIRPKPPRQGEIFYTRYIPSLDQWLSFRVPTLSSKPCPYHGPGAPKMASVPSAGGSVSVATLPTMANFADRKSDTDFLHKWMNVPRVNAAWGMAGPREKQAEFLTDALKRRHSFPVIGCWDGRPFGYFELYWVKEDRIGRLLGGEVGNHTRGVHLLVGEEDFRGPHRVPVWLSALVHYCWLADTRTETVLADPRIDNTKAIDYLQQVGFYKQNEVAFPHKQSAVMKIDRESWEAPVL